MSANIKFYPINMSRDLPISCPSTFIEIINKAFHTFPLILTKQDIPKIEGIKAALSTNVEDDFALLMEAIDKYGSIKIFADY